MTPRTYTAIDPAPLAKLVIAFLWAHMLAAAVYAIGCTIQLNELNRLPPVADPALGLESDLIIAVTALTYFVVNLATAFLVLKWIYRTNRNGHAFSRRLLVVRPHWAIIWFFIPIAFLFKPFEGMMQTWGASTDPSNWRRVPTPGILRWWWGLFLVNTIVGNAGARLIFKQDLGSMQLSAGIDIFTSIVDVPLDLLFMQVVRKLTSLQTDQMMYGAFEDEPTPPVDGIIGASA